MEVSHILHKAQADGASTESITQLREALQGLDVPADLAEALPPALQFVGPRPWINAIKALYSKGNTQGGTTDERN
uniref:Uncharacterized protein n=1 Tax=Gracilinema caldarium TaxID=215591 RepID=A0A7C3I8G6_9SPIR